MSKKNLTSLAAIADIVASAAVVISLVFVVLSLNQNTEALRSSNDNYLYELMDQHLSDVQLDPNFAQIILKSASSEALSPEEELRLEIWIFRQLNTWELAFSRYQDGLMDPTDWSEWSETFSANILQLLSKEKWNQSKVGYGKDFVKYVDAIYADE
ncbi:MAG: hypothetical protein OEV34_14795 [Gammaproteobacteria bacterium]|nr:hypothetical protein [Gammaproteobacteria bacterium]